jgi:hypothetical protein
MGTFFRSRSIRCDGAHRHRVNIGIPASLNASLVMVMQRQRQRRHHHIMGSFVCSIDAATLARSTFFGCSLSMITSIRFDPVGMSGASFSPEVLASSLLSMGGDPFHLTKVWTRPDQAASRLFEALPATRARAPDPARNGSIMAGCCCCEAWLSVMVFLSSLPTSATQHPFL